MLSKVNACPCSDYNICSDYNNCLKNLKYSERDMS